VVLDSAGGFGHYLCMAIISLEIVLHQAEVDVKVCFVDGEKLEIQSPDILRL
jgi:hypothetical protein